MARKKKSQQSRGEPGARLSSGRTKSHSPPPPPQADSPVEEVSAHEVLAFPVVAVGASAGGLEAFTQMLTALPVDTGMAFVLVQHLDPTHASMLTEILSRSTTMPVNEVQDQMPVEPNHVYVIPPGTNMVISGGILKLSPRKGRGQHRPIDHFMRSLAEDQRHKAIGVVLSGSASDGTVGLQQIKGEGGFTFAQDDTAQHGSMPISAISAGCVDFVLPPNKIAKELARISRHPYIARTAEPGPGPALDENMRRTLDLICNTTGVDFSHYKRNTLYRRITRRMILHKMEGLKDYVEFLKDNPPEVEALYQDILISVTSFFRNPESFDVLKSSVFPKLTEDRSRHDPMRIWALGCSTGEEAYSIAITFAEFAEAAGLAIPVQIFATDLNEVGIERARAGIYAKNIIHDVSPERLRRFFVEMDGGYRISKTIRDMCVFAAHNVLSAPPFCHIDLISCRNLLIYLEPVLQQRVIPILHYALKPSGFLWLGNSETIGSYRDLFEIVAPKHKVYSKKAALPGRAHLPHGESLLGHRTDLDERRQRESGPGIADAQKEADRILLQRYAPAAVLINADMEILQFRGDTSPYLAPAPGKASLNLMKMLREGLLVPVRAAIHSAQREEAPIRQEAVRIRSASGFREAHIEVVPIEGNPAPEGCFLVMFEEAADLRTRAPLEPQLPAKDREEVRESEDRQTVRLTQELAATREYLQSVIEQQEAANEELQSSNEEVQSANEELQSINEELETSKEEIQSSNEELATVNDELQNRNVELNQSNNDLVNFLGSAQMAIIMLGSDLRIRRLTPMAEKLLNLVATDVGRPITDIKLHLNLPDLEQQLLEVIDTISIKETEVQDKQGRWYSLRLRPYKTLDNRIDGVVMVLFDINALKQQEESMQRQADLLDHAHEPIVIWKLDGEITYWNKGAERTYGFSREEALGQNVHSLLHTTSFPGEILQALERDGQWAGELTHTGRDGGQVVVDSSMALITEVDGGRSVIENNLPIGKRKQMEDDLRRQADDLTTADQAKDDFLAMLAHELRNPLAPICNAVQVLKNPSIDEPTMAWIREMIERQAQAMSRMIDDLLDVSRVTKGKVHLRKEAVELITIISGAADVLGAEIKIRRQALQLDFPPQAVYLQADPLRLEQVFVNLLGNASKFSPIDGHIGVAVEIVSTPSSKPLSRPEQRKSAEFAPDRNLEAVIRIRDDGMGIESKNLTHVFDLFMQADQSLDRSRGGLGIGLTLVRNLVEMHGGSVEARSAGIGRGSEFVVRLPEVSLSPRRTDREEAAKGTRAQPPPPRRILVVDDNLDAAESLALLLRLGGHDAEVAHTGPTALENARSFQPEIILLDIGLPGMDGYEVVRELRKDPSLKNAFIIALSGYGREEDRRRAQEAGFDYHLIKPIESEVLDKLLRYTSADGD